MIDRNSLREISKDVETALADVAAKHGIVIKCGGGKYGGNFGSIKLELSVKAAAGEDSVLMTKEAEIFKVNATMFGFEATDLGREFTANRENWRIIGMKAHARKNNILIENLSTKKRHVCPEKFIPFWSDPFAKMKLTLVEAPNSLLR